MQRKIHSAAAVPLMPVPAEIVGILHLYQPVMLIALKADFGLPHPFIPIAVVALEVLVRLHQDFGFVPAFNADVAPSILNSNGATC